MNAMAAVTTCPEEDGICDEDRDAMHIMPISILPVQSKGLRRARMVKNPQLDSMVELFHMKEGSGHATVEGVANVLGLTERNHPDLVLLRKVAQMPSFDVYSLRILLRGCGIAVSDSSALKLSDKRVASLSAYMSTFTKPLVAEIFDQDMQVEGFTDLVGLMRNCPANTVRERLTRMADKLGLEIAAIPNFLEDYADIFMSLSYYRQCLDQILPPIQDFMECMRELRTNFQLRHDVNLMATIELIEKTINSHTASVTGQLESFDRGTNDMWSDLTAERFRKIEALIRSYHISIGGVLCALSVKMNAWVRLFPAPTAGGPMRRAEFIMSDMRQGIDRIRDVTSTAPVLSQLQS